MSESAEPVREALTEAGPLTRRELEYETGLTEPQVLARLDLLLEAGDVERGRGDEDGRKRVYSLC